MELDEKLEIMEKHMRVSWSQIDAYISEALGYGTPDSRKYLGPIWAKNKWPLFKKFGDRLALHSEVENTLSEKDITDSYREQVLEEIKFLSIEANLVAAFFFNHFDLEELRLNRVASNTEFSGKKIGKGMKITKALKFFISDKKELDLVQTAFSRFIQCLEAKGKLDISIDIFDILCMSVNDKKRWRSCHHFIDGEYGGGAWSYALDGSSAIAQIYTEYSESGVADKIWRQMVWFDEKQEGAILSRQYPSSNSNNRKSTQDLLAKELGGDQTVFGFVGSNDIVGFITNSGDYHYNDINHGAISKVMTVVFDGSNLTEKAGRDAMRTAISENEYSPLFIIGVDNVPNVRNGFGTESYEWDEGEWY